MTFDFIFEWSFSFILFILPILVNVAFVTLLERKILGLSQLRLGPNKVSIGGLLQPFSDAVKLFLKQSESNLNSNIYMFNMAPVAMFVVVLTLWVIITSYYSMKFMLSFMLFIMVLGLGVYPLLFSGWSSNSKYAMIGAMRGVAQTISYEISLALLIMSMIVTNVSFNSNCLINCPTMAIFPVILILWMIMAVAETNRTPFDFAEGESELVSGFNIEYGSIGFVLIFLSEYAMILMFSSLSVCVMLASSVVSPTGAFLSVLFSCLWILLRSTFPRYRYDLLMGVAWKSLLPETLGVLSLVWSMVA